MFEMTSKKIKSYKKGQKLKKKLPPPGGLEPWTSGLLKFQLFRLRSKWLQILDWQPRGHKYDKFDQINGSQLGKTPRKWLFSLKLRPKLDSEGFIRSQISWRIWIWPKKFNFLISPISPPSLQPNDWKLAKMAGQKAGHVETMPEISFFEVKKVARCLQMLKTHFHPLKWPNLTENGRNG